MEPGTTEWPGKAPARMPGFGWGRGWGRRGREGGGGEEGGGGGGEEGAVPGRGRVRVLGPRSSSSVPASVPRRPRSRSAEGPQPGVKARGQARVRPGRREPAAGTQIGDPHWDLQGHGGGLGRGARGGGQRAGGEDGPPAPPRHKARTHLTHLTGPGGAPREAAPTGRVTQRPRMDAVGTMVFLTPLTPYLSPTVLLLVSCDLGLVQAGEWGERGPAPGLGGKGGGGHPGPGFTELIELTSHPAALPADRPPSPVNVTVTHLRANSATVSWDVPEGNIVIGYAISQQRQDGPGQRVIREVNTTTRACALWGLAEDSDYTVQVRSIGLRGESPPGPRVHFRTLKGSDRLPSNSSSPGDITVEGLDGERPLQTGEVVIIVVVLIMWAAVIGLFCRQYDIIKDNDSNNNPKEKEKGKGPEQSSRGRPSGTRQKKSPSINTIEV
uniref:Fibronectin type-III domain-containing protein n=1 Tax=Ornithorhynchus anatinus TaxID=9258 RepID=A0A6I8NBH0_ORNAN